jgi:DNA-binding LytR/AlgR family response regulator
MNCIIVDDDEISRGILKHFIGQVNFLNLVASCDNAAEAINAFQKNKIDLAFVDIQLPDMSGLELIKTLSKRPLIILTTSHRKYAVEGFDNSVIDYLVKPFALPRFMKAVVKAGEKFDAVNNPLQPRQQQEYFFVKKKSIVSKLYVKDILWVEALGDYVAINTADNKFILHTTLKSIESKLPSDKFARVHKSFIVAVNNISTVEETTIYIKDKQIPVGPLYKDLFIEKLNLI